ncbi:hypothetical protein ICN19_00400 [Polynucleobacter sp. AP-Capit-er-40B-B4]|uniref:hypothetical protein n=1 Tax=Polynucleobacter sp. AP-Capit-er-40B-B4 TaxID=2576927 RepID=UPI001C0B55E9|nr:hypothetical protein [Polynucleobacter sp. AP-Capit-er-40B-B4]MBU3580470.1 hypothetical protein [Polynucleobacter sp. AP-Capit-er-40B-B4]
MDFFLDNPDTTCHFIKDLGEKISVAMDDFRLFDEILGEKEKSGAPEDGDDLGLDFFTVQLPVESLAPNENQVCLVAYTEFEHGMSATNLPLGATESLKGLRFITKSVDCEGFVRQATYEENIVGSDEYNRAEQAIMGVEFHDQQFWIAPPVFQSARNRVWLYKFDEGEQNHQLDFVASKKIRWLSASDDQSKTRING